MFVSSVLRPSWWQEDFITSVSKPHKANLPSQLWRCEMPNLPNCLRISLLLLAPSIMGPTLVFCSFLLHNWRLRSCISWDTPFPDILTGELPSAKLGLCKRPLRAGSSLTSFDKAGLIVLTYVLSEMAYISYILQSFQEHATFYFTESNSTICRTVLINRDISVHIFVDKTVCCWFGPKYWKSLTLGWNTL